MSEGDSRGVFNIGSQQAGAIYQSAGDQVIHHGGGTQTIGLLSAVSDLRSAVASAQLSDADRVNADRSLDTIEAELKLPEPNRKGIGAALERVAGLLARAGGLSRAADSLHSLAQWLGPAGLAVLGILA